MTSATERRTLRMTSHAADWLQNRAVALAAGCKSHVGIYALAFATYGAGLIQSHELGEPLSFGLAGIASSALLLAVMVITCIWLAVDLVKLWRSGYPGSPTVALLRRLFNDILTPGRISNGFHVLLSIGIFAVGFTSIKANIPRTHAFDWDPVLMTLDKAFRSAAL